MQLSTPPTHTTPHHTRHYPPAVEATDDTGTRDTTQTDAGTKHRHRYKRHRHRKGHGHNHSERHRHRHRHRQRHRHRHNGQAQADAGTQAPTSPPSNTIRPSRHNPDRLHRHTAASGPRHPHAGAGSSVHRRVGALERGLILIVFHGSSSAHISDLSMCDVGSGVYD